MFQHSTTADHRIRAKRPDFAKSAGPGRPNSGLDPINKPVLTLGGRLRTPTGQCPLDDVCRRRSAHGGHHAKRRRPRPPTAAKFHLGVTSAKRVTAPGHATAHRRAGARSTGRHTVR